MSTPATRAPHVIREVLRPVVLIVDDDPRVLEALSALLVPRLEPPYIVETAASAEEALDLLNANVSSSLPMPLALVISDEKMPGQSGTDLLIALRKNPAHQAAGRIIITAYAGLPSAKRAINEAEVDRYFPKPWDAEGKLLPAMGFILARFAHRQGLDGFLVCGRVEGSAGLESVRSVRSEWWQYEVMLGVNPADFGIETPSFEEPEDAGAVHFVARRVSPREDLPAGVVRLRQANGEWLLDGLTFLPEEAGDEVETLLLRTALLHAEGEGIARVRTLAPAPRRTVYEEVGFVVAAAQPGAAQPEAAPPDASAAAGRVAMEAVVGASAGDGLAGPRGAFRARYGSERRLCACAQVGCPERDYALTRRGYFCPLDHVEGRLPPGFPSKPTL